MPFIVLEGLDGAGKSTQLAKIADLLGRDGGRFEFLHFPRFDSPVYGELIARFLRGEFGTAEDVDPYLVALLFAGDRADAAPMIRRWLEERKYVITDRYVYSNIAYQCAKYDDPARGDALRDWILDLEFNYNRLPRPDLSLFLDVPLGFVERKLSQQRGGGDRDYLKGGRDVHEESLDLQRRVRDIYLKSAARDEALHVIDCSDGKGEMDTPDNIFHKISRFLGPLL